MLLDSWELWIAALTAPMHRRLAWRVPVVLVGLILGRRAVAS